MWPFDTGDCLIEVTAWAGLTIIWYMIIHLLARDIKKKYSKIVNVFDQH